MSLGIIFKGPEGIVLAADSRVTIMAEFKEPKNMNIPATYDNATKLLKVSGQNYVGAVTYGLGVIGQKEPRTAHSYISEFEAELAKNNTKRLSVNDFAINLSNFFIKQWKNNMPENVSPGNDMVFLVGGYDENAAYGRVFEISIPTKPAPKEHYEKPGDFGIVYGGQREYVDRLIQGFDDKLPVCVQKFLNLSDKQRMELREYLRNNLTAHIPYAFLPLQDCVDVSIFLIKTTILMQKWIVDVRGVGGAIDVAIITKIDGFKSVQQKSIIGEK